MRMAQSWLWDSQIAVKKKKKSHSHLPTHAKKISHTMDHTHEVK